MKIMKRVSLRTLANWMFYVSLWDFSTDVCYFASRPSINNFLWWLSIGTFTLTLFGPMIILMFGQVFKTILNTLVFKSEKFKLETFIKESKEMFRLSHSFVFKTILDEDIPRKKAIFRTACLMHVTFESFPQFVLQSVTNQKFHIWLDPFPLLSVLSSLAMISLTLIISIKTDKYFL
jgi:hypothetical protein